MEEALSFLDEGSDRHISLPDDQQERVLIVGDVHGCADELAELLLKYATPGTTVILAGDLVNKGPKSTAVLDLAISYRAYSILGNHEFATLTHCHARRTDPTATATATDDPYVWTDALTNEHLAYMAGLPFTITLPRHNAIVVHAGLVPGIPLEEQDPAAMTNMRNLVPASGDILRPTLASVTAINAPTSATIPPDPPCQPLVASSSTTAGKAWATLWQGPMRVFFGHDAARRFQHHPHAIGLDTGCLYGGNLSAVILQPNQPTSLVSVPAHRVHVMPKLPWTPLLPLVTSLATRLPGGYGPIFHAWWTDSIAHRSLGSEPVLLADLPLYPKAPIPPGGNVKLGGVWVKFAALGVFAACLTTVLWPERPSLSTQLTRIGAI